MLQSTLITKPAEWRRLRPYTIVEVKWEDAKHFQGEQTLAEASEVKPCYRYSTGYVVKIDREYCSLAQTDDRANDTGSGSQRAVCDTLTMPVGYVRSITLLSPAARR